MAQISATLLAELAELCEEGTDELLLDRLLERLLLAILLELTLEAGEEMLEALLLREDAKELLSTLEREEERELLAGDESDELMLLETDEGKELLTRLDRLLEALLLGDVTEEERELLAGDEDTTEEENELTEEEEEEEELDPPSEQAPNASPWTRCQKSWYILTLRVVLLWQTWNKKGPKELEFHEPCAPAGGKAAAEEALMALITLTPARTTIASIRLFRREGGRRCIHGFGKR